jgi:hypothetical protein
MLNTIAEMKSECDRLQNIANPTDDAVQEYCRLVDRILTTVAITRADLVVQVEMLRVHGCDWADAYDVLIEGINIVFETCRLGEAHDDRI